MLVMNEIWKDIAGYEGLYKVSNLGRVKSLTHKTGNRLIKGKLLKLVKDKYNDNYEKVSLCKSGVIRNYYVHFLVAVAFVPNPNNYPQIDHIVPVSNGGTNVASNLKWATVKMNANNAITIKNKSKAQLSASDKKSKSMIGKNTKKLLQYDRGGNLLNTYPNIKYTCMEKGYNLKTITTAIYRGTTAYGYYWKSA